MPTISNIKSGPTGTPAGNSISPRPLGSVNAAMRDLDKSADEVSALLDEGKLIGFDIAAGGVTKKTLRVLTKSIDHFREANGGNHCEMEWPEIFRLLVPHDKLFLRGVEIQRYLNCDRGHVENLISSGCLVAAKEARPGPGGSPIVTRASFEAFLKARMT